MGITLATQYWLVINEQDEIVEFATGPKPAPLPVAYRFVGYQTPTPRVEEVTKEQYYTYLKKAGATLRAVVEPEWSR